MNTNEKINSLRKLMEDNKIDAYIIPSADPHQSEYLPEHYKSRAWLSGFTGSQGLVVVTKDKAILWTDGRYFTQAEDEIKDSEIELYKMGIPGYPTYIEWLSQTLVEGNILGFDGKLMPRSDVEEINSLLKEKNIKINGNFDFIDEIWTNRPIKPDSKAFVYETKYTGYTAKEKIEMVREIMKAKKVDNYLISTLDDIAWVYNIRGRDIPSNPMILSYGLITLDKAYLCIDENKLNDEVIEHLKENNIIIKDYDEILDLVKAIESNEKVILDKTKVNNWLYEGIKEDIIVKNEINITAKLKSVKNETEMKNQKNAYIKDGIAFTKVIHWIEENKGNINEYDVSEKLEEFRSENDLYIEPSFKSIAAYESNAAMMHYRPSKDKSSILEKRGTFLLDAGGQYIDGTTDTTRTIRLGDVSDEQIKDFTLTLMSHINLISSRFLEGTSGFKLDAIARYPMWQEGLDYKCGTGHGVGHFLSVHEGPHRIANVFNDVALEEGMVVTIEPGVYKPGKHGIRIENVGLVRKDINTDSGQFLSFEVLSFVPIDTSLVNKDMLSKRDIDWLNAYNKKVYEKLKDHLDQDVKDWLKEKTKEI